MMQWPWDRAQPDDWLPRSLRLCWAGSTDGGGDGGAGFSGAFDSGGFGGAFTGGGDWGSSGTFDASAFNAGGDVNAFTGTAYDASTAGTGAGGGGDWGSFQATSYGGMNAPNPTFADIAGPNPGVTTGGGDWGSAGPYSAAGTGGGPGGVFSFGDQGGYAPAGGGVGPFGDYAPAGGGGGYAPAGGGGGYAPAGGGGRSGGGAFSSPSRSSVTDSTPGYIGTASGGKDVTPAAPAYGGGIGKGGASDETGSEEPEGPAAPAPAPASDFGKPAAEPEGGGKDAPAAAPSEPEGGGKSEPAGGKDDAPSAQPQSTQTSPSAFGPHTISSVAAAVYGPEGSPDAIAAAGQRASETTDYKSAADIVAGDLYGDRSAVDYQGSPYADMGPFQNDTPTGMDLAGDRSTQTGAINPNSLFSMGWDPANANEGRGADYASGRAAQDYVTSLVSGAPLGAAAPSVLSTLSAATGISVPGWLGGALTSGGLVGGMFGAPTGRGTIDLSALNPNTWVDINSPTGAPWGPSGTAFDFQSLAEQGRAGQINDLASQLGIENISPTQGIDPGSEQYGTQDYAPGGIEPGAEQTGVETGINPGAEQYGIEPAAPAIEATIPGDRDATSFEGEQGQITSFIPGSREATNWDYQPTTDVISPPAIDAATTAAQDAAARGGDPVDQANAAAAAALAAGATVEQADAIAGAVYTAAANQGNLAGPDVMAGGRAGTQFTAQTPGGELGISMTPGSRSAPNLPTINLPSLTVDAPGTVSAPQGIEPGAEQYGVPAPQGIEPGAEQYGVQTGGIEPGAEQYGVNTGIEPGAEQYGVQTPQGLNPGAEQYGINFQPQSPPPPGLLQMAPPSWVPGQQTAGTVTGPPSWAPGTPSSNLPPGAPGTPPPAPAAPPGPQQDNDDDAPEPGDRSAPPGDPNAPRPPGDIPAQPGRLVGSNGTYENPHADTPQTSRDYRDSGRTDYPQGRPGIDFRTARQAGIEPQFRTGDINTGDLDARLIENINRLLADPRTPQYVRDELTATSGYRPAHRGEAIERGMDPRLSQESVRSRANPVSGRGFPAGRPGFSNHAPGRAIDFQRGRALDYVRAHAREFGLETLGYRNGQIFDEPHIQLRGARGVAENRPSAQEQQAQRALDAQNRQAAIDRGLIAPGRGQAPTQQAAIPMPRGRPSDAPQQQAETEQQPPAPEQQPVALPPDAPVDVPAPLPPADIPAPAPFMGPPRAGRADPHWQAERAQSILKDATKGLNKDSGEAAFQAASVVAAKALAAAGIPVDMARSLMTKGALDGAIANGYGPGGPNSTVMGFSIWGKVQSTIAEGVNAALQGYNPNATGPTPQGGRYGPGPVQGPFDFQPDAPAAPGKRSEAPFGTFTLAGLSQAPGREPVAGEPATAYPEDYGRPGDVGARESIFQGTAPTIEQLSPITAPPARGPMPQGPEMQPLGGVQQASLFDMLSGALSQFNPISTAEARGARGSRGAEVRDEPTHDASVVAGRLTDARANIVADLRTNQGLLNLFDLIATMEVGSQGKAAVLAFVEMQMNRAAAEARAEGRQATGKDLARLLNDRTNYAESWGKIDAGKGKTGALTGDVFADVAEGSNTSKGSTGNASARVGFGGNPANAKVGNERFGTENYASHNAWYQSLYGPPMRAEIIGGPEASPASVFTAMPQAEPVEARAEGGPVDKGQPYVVGEEGPEYFVPDEPGTIYPHMPQPGRGDPNIGRWPKVTAPDYPGRYRGLEGGIKQATRNAQDPAPGLMEMIDSERMRLNQANWRRMLSDPRLIALGRSQMEDRRDQPPAGRLPTDPPWGYIPDPSIIPEPPNEMSRQLGYDAIRRPPPRTIIGNRRY